MANTKIAFPQSSDEMEVYQAKQKAGEYVFENGSWFQVGQTLATPTPTPTATTTPTTTAQPTSTQQTTQPAATGYTGPSVVDYLVSIGQPADFASRAKYAQQYGITNYTGTAEQNTQLLTMMRGKTTTPVQPTTQPVQPTTQPAAIAPETTAPKDLETMTDDEKAQEVVSLMAQLGMEYNPDLIAAITGPTKEQQTEEEIRTELYTKYGIDPDAVFDKEPEKGFEEVYSAAYAQAGLADIKTEIDDLRKKIADAEEKRDKAMENVNENPWLSEASRVGRVSRLQDKAQNELDRLTNQLTLATNVYERGKESAENVATRALNQFAQEREWAKEELDYYMARAELDIQARLATQKEEASSQSYRYVQDYMKALAEQPVAAEKLDTQVVEANGRKLLVNTQTGETIQDLGAADVGGTGTSGGVENLTSAQLTALGFANRVEEANSILDSFTDDILNLPSWQLLAYRTAPTWAKPSWFQQMEQAEANFINAVLRKESGAAISESEFENAKAQYFAEPGNDKAVLDQKKANREMILDSLRKASGGGSATETNTPSSVSGVPSDVAGAIEAALSEGWTLEKIRTELASVYGREQGYSYLDTYMSQK